MYGTCGGDITAWLYEELTLSTYFMLNVVVIWGLGIKGRQYKGRTFWRSILCPLIGAIVTFVIFVCRGTWADRRPGPSCT